MNIFLAILLTIPFVNWLFGFFIGLSRLGILGAKATTARFFQGLFLELVWCVIAAAVLFAGALTEGHKENLFWFVPVAIGLVCHFKYNLWFINWVDSVSAEKLNEQLNREYQDFCV